jgi:hypothetical protein
MIAAFFSLYLCFSFDTQAQNSSKSTSPDSSVSRSVRMMLTDSCDCRMTHSAPDSSAGASAFALPACRAAVRAHAGGSGLGVSS